MTLSLFYDEMPRVEINERETARLGRPARHNDKDVTSEG